MYDEFRAGVGGGGGMGEKQVEIVFVSINLPHKPGGNDHRQKQQRLLLKEVPLITLACSSKGRWLL